MALKLFFDLETIPDMRHGARERYISDGAANFKAPSTLTKEKAASDLGLTDKDEIKFTSKDAMIAKWEAKFAVEKAAEYADAEWRKTSFDGGYGSICVIGYAFEDAPVKTIICDNETTGISHFHAEIHAAVEAHNMGGIEYIGHNVIGFDLPFLWKRSVINRIPYHGIPKDARHGAGRVFDTMVAWAGFKDRISLDNLAGILGLESHKGEMDGSMVCDAWLAGKKEEISEYCIKDVDLTRKIYGMIS
jgi:hypothetical protein